MSVKIFIEGGTSGPNSKYLQIQCRQGFHKLFEKCGFADRPSLRACGSRNDAYGVFKQSCAYATAHDFVGLLVDSEEPMADIDRTWDHLRQRDGWIKPDGGCDEQVLLMTTCMEAWIVAGRPTLLMYYGQYLQENALPPLVEMESRHRHDIQEKLDHATRKCKNAYKKGRRSFDVLGKLQPAELREHLPSFARCERVLRDKLG